MNLHGLLCAAALAALLLCTTPLIAAELSPTEQKIVAAVKQRSAAALQFLERTVNVNSGTMNHVGVREVGKMFRMELDQLGFAPVSAQAVFLPYWRMKQHHK